MFVSGEKVDMTFLEKRWAMTLTNTCDPQIPNNSLEVVTLSTSVQHQMTTL